MKRSIFLIAGSLLFLAGSSVAASPEDRAAGEKNAYCSQLKKDISLGTDARKVTKDNIREGHDACSVVQCAIAAGGNPQRVIAGAKDAGAPSDLVSRCAVESCAEMTRLADSGTCSLIRDEITKGQDPRKVVRTRIGGGNSACSVIKCSVASGIELREVFAGAKEAGVTSDVISRCALDACVDPSRVAAVEQDLGIYGLGYPYYDDNFVPIDTTLPQGTRDRLLSPSHF